MDENKVDVWGVYETIEKEKVVIVNGNPLRCLPVTEEEKEETLPINGLKAAGLLRPAAVIIKPWEAVDFQRLERKLGTLEERDCLKIAAEYSRQFRCIGSEKEVASSG